MADLTAVSGATAQGAIQEVGSKLIQKIFGGILWFGVGALVIGVIGYLMWYFLVFKKKFDIDIKIISERASDKTAIFFDKAALLTDSKSGGKYLKLWNTKGVELPAPKFNIFQTAGGKDYLELYRTAENIFYYLTPTKIDKRYVIRSDGKIYPMAGQVSRMIDPEMDFWSTKRKTINKGMFSSENMFMKLLPYLPAIMGGMITIFVLWVLMSHLPGILAQLTELAKSLSQYRTGAVIPA